MKIHKRLKELENKVKLTKFDIEADRELTRWFLDNPDYISQPPEQREIVMPDHISEAWKARMDRAVNPNGVPRNLSDLLHVWDEIYP